MKCRIVYKFSKTIHYSFVVQWFDVFELCLKLFKKESWCFLQFEKILLNLALL